jgi:hypothetical protein
MLQIEGHDPQASQIVPFVAHRSHAYQNYCACLNKAIYCACSISPGLNPSIALVICNVPWHAGYMYMYVLYEL